MQRPACVTSSEELIGAPPTNAGVPARCLESNASYKTALNGNCTGARPSMLRSKPQPPTNPMMMQMQSPQQGGLEASPDDPEYHEGCRRVGDHSYRMWKEQKMCDVIIKCCGGDEVKAHKTVLSTYSDFMVQNFSQVV